MAKIKITDLSKDTQISREDMKKVFGGLIQLSQSLPAGVSINSATPDWWVSQAMGSTVNPTGNTSNSMISGASVGW